MDGMRGLCGDRMKMPMAMSGYSLFYSGGFSPSRAGLLRGPMASSWLCTTTQRPEISRQTLVFLTRINSVPEAVANVTSK